ncbi:biotin transporter BioY [Neosynechococcus sphagnicola]|uniref:biotin transporter BioY n=1 Tax=Neosynechococcus sphagnicola TaxID=1501145 RepID=UPI0009079562|nr:biotin transporter BioY [Neosynechococcus sphagnicola]
MAASTELLWALVGLFLTINGTFLEAQITNPPWYWSLSGIETYPLGVTYQVGAVLLTGCLGGRNAALISQIAYLGLGLFGYPIISVFAQGGGLDYLTEPTFGYLLGFIPAAWVCGYLAFKLPTRLELLALSCLAGLLTIHSTGLLYLVLGHLLQWGKDLAALSLPEAILNYSLVPLPGQLIITCAVAILAFFAALSDALLGCWG